jgi:hypothetical protein
MSDKENIKELDKFMLEEVKTGRIEIAGLNERGENVYRLTEFGKKWFEDEQSKLGYPIMGDS